MPLGDGWERILEQVLSHACAVSLSHLQGFPQDASLLRFAGSYSSSETANIHGTVSFLLGLLNTMWLSMTYGKYNSYLLCFYQP